MKWADQLLDQRALLGQGLLILMETTVMTDGKRYQYQGQLKKLVKGPSPDTYADNLLWSGIGCLHQNSCCAQLQMPYFYRHISVATSGTVGEIEVRMHLFLLEQPLLVSWSFLLVWRTNNH